MEAVILAGGKGTRLQPYTIAIPKPLVPVGNQAILELLLQRLKKCGVTRVILCVNHLADLIVTYAQSHQLGMKVEYSKETEPLGTIGPLKLIKNLPENFLIMNGDLLTDIDFNQIYQHHLKQKALITVGVYQRKIQSDFGEVRINKEGNQVVDFIEKPERQFFVSMGVQVLNRKILNLIPPNQPFGFDQLVIKLLRGNKIVNFYHHQGYWLDIGRPQDYEKANQDIESPKLKKVFDLS